MSRHERRDPHILWRPGSQPAINIDCATRHLGFFQTRTLAHQWPRASRLAALGRCLTTGRFFGSRGATRNLSKHYGLTGLTVRSLLALVLLATSLAPAAAADLVVRVKGLTPLTGNVHLAVYDTPEKFPKSDGMIQDQIIAIDGETMTFTFTDIAPGTYALATFHDKNLNGKFDQGLFSFPLEGFAFPNGAKPGFSAPEFAEAQIEVSAGGNETEITMDYWIAQ